MKRFTSYFIGGLTSCAVLAAAVMSGQEAPPTAKGAGASRLEGTGSRTFIQEAARGNQSEIDLAEVAQQKAQNPEVKQLAEHLQTDHQAANQKLQPIAQAHGVSINGPSDSKEQRKLSKFQQLSGAEFDKQYVEDMLRDHQQDIAKFEQATTQLQDPDVKQYAQDTLPTLRDHLQRSEQAAKAIGIDQATITSILNEKPAGVGGTSEKQEQGSGSMKKGSPY